MTEKNPGYNNGYISSIKWVWVRWSDFTFIWFPFNMNWLEKVKDQEFLHLSVVLLTLIRQGIFLGLMPGHALFHQKIFCVNQFSFIDVVNRAKTFWHLSVVLLSLIRQGGVVAKCQDIGMGNPPSGRGERRWAAHPTFIHLHFSTLKLSAFFYTF